jgi:hypothetical protein
MAQRGSVVLSIELLARALAHDDPEAVALARTQLAATFPTAEERDARPVIQQMIERPGVGVEHDPRSDRWYVLGGEDGRERLHGPYASAPADYPVCTGHRDDLDHLVHDGESCPVHEEGSP